MGNLLDTPKTEKVDCHLFTSSTGLNCGGVGMQGWRIEMEDAHIIADLPSLPDHTFVAVFDGHGGSGAAIYAGQKMVSVLEATAQYKEYVAAQDPNKIDLLGDALRQSFIDIDDQLREFQESGMSDTSGCTAVVACITPKYIICSNAGDSRCVMGTAGTTKPLSEDHKPTDEGEKKRVEAAGGTVSWKRVDGDLAVSRAFGDFQYKKRPDLPPQEQKVTCDPDITIHERTPSDDVLILACDGVWDVMSSQDGVELARDIFAGGESNMQLVAEEIVDSSMNKGTASHITSFSSLYSSRVLMICYQ
mmetsp:Transcript_35359/g.65971  ORF Transcript_35359/g.65971 Transcript_35359/m.65971 type:complete len:304 (+) Transcript_35359:98-1009(+)